MIGILPSMPPPHARDRPRDYVSYSAISTYASCPLRYYFRYIANLPERTISSSLVFGSAVHRSVEHHFNELMAGIASLAHHCRRSCKTGAMASTT